MVNIKYTLKIQDRLAHISEAGQTKVGFRRITQVVVEGHSCTFQFMSKTTSSQMLKSAEHNLTGWISLNICHNSFISYCNLPAISGMIQSLGSDVISESKGKGGGVIVRKRCQDNLSTHNEKKQFIQNYKKVSQWPLVLYNLCQITNCPELYTHHQLSCRRLYLLVENSSSSPAQECGASLSSITLRPGAQALIHT